MDKYDRYSKMCSEEHIAGRFLDTWKQLDANFLGNQKPHDFYEHREGNVI